MSLYVDAAAAGPKAKGAAGNEAAATEVLTAGGFDQALQARPWLLARLWLVECGWVSRRLRCGRAAKEGT